MHIAQYCTIIARKGTETLYQETCGMTCLSYDERLHQLDLPRLELRRLHLDLIYCYKIVFGLVAVNIDDFF